MVSMETSASAQQGAARHCLSSCYGCETRSPALREEHILRMFESGAPKIFGPKWGGVTGVWRDHHNKELQNFYYSSNIIIIISATSKAIRWAGHVARVARNA